MTDHTTDAPHRGAALTRQQVLDILTEAHNSNARANLRGADLRGADLRGADLRWANLRGADLRGADLRGANLRGANLRWANLRWADLRGADLRGADLRGADLRWANLRGADLRGADLSGADLRWANLRWANLRGADLSSSCQVLSVTGLPSGHAILAPLPDGWRLTVGCWSGTIAELRALIAADDGWPEARGAQIAARRPMLAALADMCEAWATDHADVLAEITAKWGTETEADA
ncbi:pentapeptide repeat-containing protein [Gordonia sp. PP30]|uniref:pentapeptide repeat-containing protein n=1 Tax=Gordonia sp. PP30 TaxID=2935861 RepID=UPI001FFEE910|nr:pentapeptide repeat-containing protein [Gordonia sp. PP30]UQE73868.1 pentapeptide repeat-containing protein [Gordonia sp. PP30]